MPPTRATERQLDLAVEEALFTAGQEVTPNTFTDGNIPSNVYSGADIKIIVHLPNDEASAALSEIEQLQAEIDQLAIMRDRADTAASTRDSISRLEERVSVLMTQVTESEGIAAEIAELQSLSVSIFREKFPVRRLGSVYPVSFTRGPRTIAGSMVVTVFHYHVFQEFLERTRYRSTGVGDWDRHRWSTMITDQLPPLDISIKFANEYGNISWMAILGVEFVQEGMTMSIEDLFVEGVHQYVARDIDLIRNVANRTMEANRGVGENLTGTRLLQSELARRSLERRNPFL